VTAHAPLAPEFALIARHFRPLAGQGGLNLADDAALLTPPPGRELVLSADAMVAGVHFLPEDPPETIGRKLLRVNLSDLAAMGADPLAYLMTVALPRGMPDAWLEGFVAGLALDQAEFALQVLGGDTVSTPGPVTLSLTILGTVQPGQALRRSGARPGDELWVSGTIGDGALGLHAARGEIPDPDGYLAGRYRLPTPRIALGQALRGIATACMDVSDGLVQDLGHLARASGCGAVLYAGLVPHSRQAAGADPALLLTGGDDYELLFAARPGTVPTEISQNMAATRIGHFSHGPSDVLVLDQAGQPMALSRQGWSHF